MTVLRIAPSPRTRWRGPRTRQNERGCMSADLWRCPGTAVPQTNNPSGGMLRSISYSMQPRGAKDEEGRSGTRARGNASAHGCLLCLHRALHTPCRLRVVGAVGADELIELSEREQRARARERERERASERERLYQKTMSGGLGLLSAYHILTTYTSGALRRCGAQVPLSDQRDGFAFRL